MDKLEIALQQEMQLRAGIIKQPLEGLLYDLDLMPEQCKSGIANLRRIAVEKLCKEIERLKKERQWIRTKDEFPKECQVVICYDNQSERIKEAIFYNGSFDVDSIDNEIILTDVTHWMALPEVPEK